jgi:uncharacterized membrane protein
MAFWERLQAIQVNKTRVALLIVILLALILRLARLGLQPLWWDEGWSLYFATSAPRSMLELTAVDIHPPFYYLLLHLWIGLFGSGALPVRILSVLVGTVTVPLLFLTGQRLLGDRGGLLAAFLLAISPFHIYYSQEVRMYGLVTLLGLLAFYFAVRWQQAHRGIGSLVGYVLAATTALYTQYYAAFLLLALNLVVLTHLLRPGSSLPSPQPLHQRGRGPGVRVKTAPETDPSPGSNNLLAWLAAQLAVALLFLPWLLYAGDKLSTYVRFKIEVEQDPSLGLFTYLIRHLAAFNWGHAGGSWAGWWWMGLLPLAVLILCLVFVGLRRRHTEPREPGSGNCDWSLAILVVTLACGFVVNLILPFNPPQSERLLLLALPAYLFLVVGALLVLWRRQRALAALSGTVYVLAAVLSLSLFYTVPRYPDDDYRPIASKIQALGLPSDAILNVHPWQVGYFQAYIPDEARPSLVLTPREVIPRERQLWHDDPARMAAELDALLAKHGRLWFPDSRFMGRVLEQEIGAYLAANAYQTASEWYGENTVLSFYVMDEPVEAATGHRPVARFGEWLELESAALNTGSLEAGRGVVTTDLTWSVLERPGERYHVGLRLVDETGRVWAQRDSTPDGGLAHFFEFPVEELRLDRHGLLVPAGTPPGDYQVTLRVYRSQDVAVLPAAFEGGSGGEVILGTVRVVRPDPPPPLEALAITRTEDVEFVGKVRLAGYGLGNNTPLRPGEALEVDLFWQALTAPGEDFSPRLQLLDGDQVVAELTEKPVAGTYPTAWWQPGELVRDPHTLFLPATVPAGSYRGLALSLIRASNGQPVESNSGDIIVILDAPIEVVGREPNYWPTSPGYRQPAQFGTSVELVGFDMREAVRAPGSPLEVTLHWHAIETPDRHYHTFVHLLDDKGNIVAQHNGPPGEGKLPTLGWLPGEYLIDTHLLQLPYDLPDGIYHLGVGLYDPVTGLRLGERLLLSALVPTEANGGCNCR